VGLYPCAVLLAVWLVVSEEGKRVWKETETRSFGFSNRFSNKQKEKRRKWGDTDRFALVV